MPANSLELVVICTGHLVASAKLFGTAADGRGCLIMGGRQLSPETSGLDGLVPPLVRLPPCPE